MARARSPHAAFDAHAEQGEVAEQVEQLVASELVARAQLQVVQVTARDAYVVLVEYLLEVFQLLLRNGILDNDDRVVQIAALDEVHLEQRLQFVQEDEGAAGGYLLCVVVEGVQRGILVADDLRVVVYVHRYGELVIGIYDYSDALVGDRIDLLLGHLVIFAVGLLLDQTHLEDLLCIFACRAVHDGHLGGVDVDHCVVDTHRPQGREDMLYGADTCGALFYRSSARCVGDIFAQGGNRR